MPQHEPSTQTPRETLTGLRIVWGALLLGLGVIVAMAAAVGPVAPDLSDGTRRMLFVIAVGLLVVGVPVGLFARNQTYKAHWRGNAITPGGYRTGNVLLFAILDAVACVGAAFVAMIGPHAGLIAVAAAAWLVMLANYPTGKPMQAREPELPEPEKL